VDELLGEQDAACLGDGHRRCAKMLPEEAPELPITHTETTGKIFDAGLVQGPQLDQGQSARDGIRRAAPCPHVRRRLRPTAQARAKTGFLSRRCRGEENHVLGSGRPSRADRTAINARGRHAREETAVESAVAEANRAVTCIMIQVH